jgi:DNA adenine methylase
MKNKIVQPVVKWAGGKRQLLPEIRKLIPKGIRTYYEPFLGGGAVFFAIQPHHAIVNDNNAELINMYTVVRDNVEELIADLQRHRNASEYFYEIRELDRSPEYNAITPIQRASRLIYLNKTCYNGLFRVNKSGEFNAPFGRYKNPNIVNEFVLRAVSGYLNGNNIEFINEDFERAVEGARRSSFVYFDPPYYPISGSSNFTGYTIDGFSRNDQIRLKNLCDRLDEKGVRWLLSNSSSPFIIDLYKNKNYHINYVAASRAINRNADGRGEVTEVLVRNYETD